MTAIIKAIAYLHIIEILYLSEENEVAEAAKTKNQSCNANVREVRYLNAVCIGFTFNIFAITQLLLQLQRSQLISISLFVCHLTLQAKWVKQGRCFYQTAALINVKQSCAVPSQNHKLIANEAAKCHQIRTNMLYLCPQCTH